MGLPGSSSSLHRVQPATLVHELHLQHSAFGSEEVFVLSQEVVAAFDEFLGDFTVHLGSLSPGVVIVAGPVEDGISVFPHVPGIGHEFVDEGHSPSSAGLLVALAAVEVLLAGGHSLGHPPQLEIVPSNPVLFFQSPSHLIGELPGSCVGFAFSPAFEFCHYFLLKVRVGFLFGQVFVQSLLAFFPCLVGAVQVAAFDHVNCGLFFLTALDAAVVVPLMAQFHGATYSAPAGAVFAEPSPHSFGLFLQGLVGSVPVGVVECLFSEAIFLLPVLLHFFFHYQFVDFLFAEFGQFSSFPIDGDFLVLQFVGGSGCFLVFPPEFLGLLVHCYVLFGPPVEFVFLLLLVLMALNPFEVDFDWKLSQQVAALPYHVEVIGFGFGRVFRGDGFDRSFAVHTKFHAA